MPRSQRCTEPSSQHPATVSPSGENRTSFTRPTALRSTPRGWSVAASQRQTAEFAIAVAIVCPSAAKHTESTLPSPRITGAIVASASQTRTVPSPEPVATQPSAATVAIDQIVAVWP